MGNRPQRIVYTHYMRAPVVSNDVVWSAVHATHSHNIINNIMILSCNGTNTSLGRVFTLLSLYSLTAML